MLSWYPVVSLLHKTKQAGFRRSFVMSSSTDPLPLLSGQSIYPPLDPVHDSSLENLQFSLSNTTFQLVVVDDSTRVTLWCSYSDCS